MVAVVSCGVVIFEADPGAADAPGILAGDRVFVCRATGTRRWDLPKGVMDPGESPREAAVREAWEESGLCLPPESLDDLGAYPYLPGKRLHLFALHVQPAAFEAEDCRCRTFFRHALSGRWLPEADGFAWQRLAERGEWAGKGLARVLGGLDWARVRRLPRQARLELDLTPVAAPSSPAALR